MRTGRVETYVHSDTTTANKAMAAVAVLAQSEQGARTSEFQAFAKKAAKFAFAAGAMSWEDVINMFPEIEEERMALSKLLKEKIEVADIVRLAL
jgi:hypothetical protein